MQSHAFIIQIYPSYKYAWIQICSYKYTYKYTLHHQTSYSSIFVPGFAVWGSVCTCITLCHTHMPMHPHMRSTSHMKSPCKSETSTPHFAEFPRRPHNLTLLPLQSLIPYHMSENPLHIASPLLPLKTSSLQHPNAPLNEKMLPMIPYPKWEDAPTTS